MRSTTEKPALRSAEDFADAKHLQPVLEDDALLFSVDDILLLAQNEQGQDPSKSKTADPSHSVQQKVQELEEELANLQAQFASYRTAVSTTLDERWSSSESTIKPAPSASSSSSSSRGARAPASTAADPPSLHSAPVRDDDTHYFDSYAYNDIHETMLKDRIRTDAYRDFIYAHKPLFKDATVLDIGCGTSILSMFAAKAGAKQVFAVDNSNIIAKAKEIVATNQLGDTIKLVRGKVEDVALPWPSEPTLRASQTSTERPPQSQTTTPKVDIIISEWMGYGLLYESMLDSVITARNTHLNPQTGIMVPSHCTLHIAPLSCADFVADSIGFWDDVYGFDMRPMTEKIADDVIVRSFGVEDVASEGSARFRTLDLRTIEVKDLEWGCKRADGAADEKSNTQIDANAGAFSVTLAHDLPSGLDAWGIWFDTFFLPTRTAELPSDARAETWPTNDDARGNAFTTGPGGKETHWRAAMLLVDPKSKTARRAKEAGGFKQGDIVEGNVAYRKAEDNSRALEIEVNWAVKGREEETRAQQTWFLR